MIREFEVKTTDIGTAYMCGYVNDVYFKEHLTVEFTQDLMGVFRYNYDGTEKSYEQQKSELQAHFLTTVLRRPDFRELVREQKLKTVLDD